MILVYNVISWLLLLGIPLYGLRRGGSQVFATGLCILLSGMVVPMLASSLSFSYPLGHRPDTEGSVGMWQLVLYTLFFILSIILGAYINRFLQWSFDPFDWMVGGVLGIIVAVIAVRLFLSALMMTYDGLPEQQAIEHLFLTRQLIYADGLNGVTQFFTDLTNPKPVDIHIPERN